MNPAIFLDRDGTINVEKKYLYQIKEFEYITGAIEAMRLFTQMGFILAVITNQSGIARGYYTERDFWHLSEWMKKDLLKKGIPIRKIYYCPHYEEGRVFPYAVACNCRKPGTDLFWQAKEELQIDMKNSYAIGDKPRDLSVCVESEAQGILLDERDLNTIQDFQILQHTRKTIWQCGSLLEAAEMIADFRQRKK